MVSIVLFVLAAVAAATAKSLPYHSEAIVAQFKEFTVTYDKHYEDELEEAFRFGIFLKNLDLIDHLNRQSDHAEFGITQFADMIYKEINMCDTGLEKPDLGYGCVPNSDVGDINVTDTQFDWRSKGVVTSVKDQMRCGSCWAFSTIGNVESVNAIKTGSLVRLSEQQLVDCDRSNFGCKGGYPKNALTYLVSKGSMSESAYPYIGQDGSCRYDPSQVSVRISTCYILNVPEDAFAQKLQQMGPLSILIDASMLASYRGGVISGPSCAGGQIDHAVLLVGFGQEGGIPYWIVKNSWGPGWGEQGYFRLQRGVNCLVLASTPPVTAA